MSAKGEEVRQGRPQVSEIYDFFLQLFLLCEIFFRTTSYPSWNCGYVQMLRILVVNVAISTFLVRL